MTEEMVQSDMLLQVRSLKKYFPIQRGFRRKVVGYVKAVDDVDFTIRRAKPWGSSARAAAARALLPAW